MADTIEKIYCTDGRDNDLAAILAATKNNDPATVMAAMGGGMNNWMNNPFVYLVWMMFANRMWGGEQNCNPAIQAQIDSLRNQMADNQNSNLLMDAVHGNTAAITQLAGNLNCDFNALNGAICDVRGGVDRLSGQVGFSAERVINSVSQGNLQMIQALKDCCCQTQQSIIKMGYHFTDKLADYASKKMVNTSGSAHSWTTEQLRSVLGPFTPTHNETSGDMAYTANMAYADFYPAVLDTVDKCVTYAKLVASDPDGYEGMEFMRWTSDATGKSLTLNWEDFI